MSGQIQIKEQSIIQFTHQMRMVIRVRLLPLVRVGMNSVLYILHQPQEALIG